MYSSLPWVHPSDHPRVVEVFEKLASPVRFKRGAVIPVGKASCDVLYIQRGLCATFAGGEAGHPKVLALFPAQRVMGAIKAVTEEPVNLIARVLVDVEALRLSPEVFRTAMFSNMELARLVMRGLLVKQESQFEGLVTNVALDAHARLKVLLRTLLAADQQPLTLGWNALPYRLTADEYASIVHLTRVSVSRIFSEWIADETMRRVGRRVEVHSRLFDAVYDWMSQR